MNDDIFVSEYLRNLNAVPSSTLPPIPEDPQENTFDGVSKDILNLQDLEQKLNDVNKALTNFETKSNEWHDFLIQSKDEMDFDSETFKQYEIDETATLASINRIKDYLLKIKSELTTLRDTLKQ